jgi:hypothetical protein
MASSVSGATFSDVGVNHWAYASIKRVADAGIIDGIDGKFLGQQELNRYQMATIINRMIEAVEDMGEDKAIDPVALIELRKLAKEFAGEINEIKVRLDSFENRLSLLEEKAGSVKFSSEETDKSDALCLGAGAPADNQILSRKKKKISIGGIAKTWWRSLEGVGNEFDVRNARILVLGDISEDIKFLFQTEMAHDNSTGTDWPSMIDMKVTFNLDKEDSYKTNLSIGRFIPHFSRYGCVAINTMDFVQYPLFHWRGLAIWRQSGAELKSRNNDKTFAWSFGVTNGTLVNDNDWSGDVPDVPGDGTSDGKDFYLRVDFTPKNSKITGSIGYWNGETDSPTVDDLDKTMIDAFVEYKAGPWRALVDYVMATDEAEAGDDIDKNSFMAQLIHFRPGSRLEYLVRWEDFESDSMSVGGIPYTNYKEQWTTIGVNWFLEGRNCFLGLNYIDKNDNTAGTPLGDSKEYVLQLTMIF